MNSRHTSFRALLACKTVPAKFQCCIIFCWTLCLHFMLNYATWQKRYFFPLCVFFGIAYTNLVHRFNVRRYASEKLMDKSRENESCPYGKLRKLTPFVIQRKLVHVNNKKKLSIERWQKKMQSHVSFVLRRRTKSAQIVMMMCIFVAKSI